MKNTKYKKGSKELILQLAKPAHFDYGRNFCPPHQQIHYCNSYNPKTGIVVWGICGYSKKEVLELKQQIESHMKFNEVVGYFTFK